MTVLFHTSISSFLLSQNIFNWKDTLAMWNVFCKKKRLNGHDHYFFDRKYATMGLNSLFIIITHIQCSYDFMRFFFNFCTHHLTCETFFAKKRLNGHDHYFFDRKYATMGLNSLFIIITHIQCSYDFMRFFFNFCTHHLTVIFFITILWKYE